MCENVQVNKRSVGGKISLSGVLAILFFLLYFIIGLVCFRDYGCGPDEGMERQTSLVNYRYAVEKLHLPITPEAQTWMAYLPPLKEYRDRYYGTALHLPLTLIESWTNFTMEPAQFYGMRHLYTFLNFYLAMICLYRILRRRFPLRGALFPLAGVLMTILTPRFFAESFYNNKDILFYSWYLISALFLIRWLERPNFRRAAVAGTVCALTINTRFNGIAICLAAIGVFALDCLRRKKARKQELLSLVTLFLTTCAVFYIVTPNFWENPGAVLMETFAFNAHHPNHGSDGNLFFGRLVDSTTISYFIPMWILLTVPTAILFFTAGGTLLSIGRGLRDWSRGRFDAAGRMDLLMLTAGFLPVLAIILMRVVIYNGWRHSYFAYGAMIYFAMVALDGALSALRGKRQAAKIAAAIGVAMLGLSCLQNAFWIVKNHPYEYVYFAPLFRDQADLFSGDYWGISTRDLEAYILTNDPRPLVTVCHDFTPTGSVNRGLFPPGQREKIDLIHGQENADYILFTRDDKRKAEAVFPGFEKVFSIVVDQDEIGMVFRRIDESEKR